MKTAIVILSLFALCLPVQAAKRPQGPIKCWNCDQIYHPTPEKPNCPYCGSPPQKPRYR